MTGRGAVPDARLVDSSRSYDAEQIQQQQQLDYEWRGDEPESQPPAKNMADRWERFKIYMARLRKDTIFMLELLFMILGAIYTTLFVFAESSNDGRVIFAFILLLVLACVVAVVMFRFNGSPRILKETVIRPKTIIIYSMLVVLFGCNIVKPLLGARTVVNTAAYCLMVALLVLTDVLIDRHRSVYLLMVMFFVGTSLYNIYVWSFTATEKNTILVESWGQSVKKRTVLRTIQLSLLIQLLEGMLRLIRTRNRKLPGIYVFETKGCYRPKYTKLPRNPDTIRRLTRFLMLNEILSVIWYILFAGVFYDAQDHYWLVALVSINFVILVIVYCCVAYKNVDFKSVKRLFKEPNVWLLLVLTAILGWSTFRRPLNKILTPLLGSYFVFHFTSYILMDAFIVVDRVGRLMLGFFGCVVCSLTLLSIVFLKSTKIESFLVQSGDFDLSKRDLWRVVFFNMLFFLFGAVVHDLQDKTMKCFLFVRRPKPRQNVLFAELMTKSTRFSRQSLGNPEHWIRRGSPGHLELAHIHDGDGIRGTIVAV